MDPASTATDSDFDRLIWSRAPMVKCTHEPSSGLRVADGMTCDGAATISTLEESTIRQARRRLVPFLAVLFVVSFIDRTNVGFAVLRLRQDLGISTTSYGLGAGIFFIGYFLCEVPSNIALCRFGARRWIARIMISWGVIATLMAFVQSLGQFLTLRTLLGIAEAGFFPGVIYYLTLWFPERYRARIIAGFYLGLPISQVIGAPVSAALIRLGDAWGYAGWRLMFFAEGLPAIALGMAALFYLTDRPIEAQWLSAEQRHWLQSKLDSEQRKTPMPPDLWRDISRALANGQVLSLALIYFGITAGSNAMNFFLPSVLQDFAATFHLHVGLAMTGALTALPYAVAAIVMVWWCRHSDRHGERRLHCAGAVILAGLALAGAFMIKHPLVMLLGFTVAAASVYSAINVFWTIPARVLSGVGAAVAIGVINSVGNLSGFVAPYVTGRLYDATHSYAPGFRVIAATLIAAGVALPVIIRSTAAGGSSR